MDSLGWQSTAQHSTALRSTAQRPRPQVPAGSQLTGLPTVVPQSPAGRVRCCYIIRHWSGGWATWDGVCLSSSGGPGRQAHQTSLSPGWACWLASLACASVRPDTVSTAAHSRACTAAGVGHSPAAYGEGGMLAEHSTASEREVSSRRRGWSRGPTSGRRWPHGNAGRMLILHQR